MILRLCRHNYEVFVTWMDCTNCRACMVTTALRDLQLPAAQVMAVTGHRSELQMRRDYHLMQLLSHDKEI